MNFDWLVKLVKCSQPLILIYIGGNFVHHYGGLTSIYWPLSYPFRSLDYLPQIKILGYMSFKFL